MTERTSNVREWLFRAIMFEADAEKFRSAGIRLGADQTSIDVRLMEEVLTPFPVPLRNQAMQMTRLYALIYCFENSVRQLIREKLSDKHGAEWWEKAIPSKVKAYVKNRSETADANSWLEGEKSDPLQFVDFGHLTDIIVNNWDDFTDLVPTQHWLKQRLDELEQARNYIAHNRLLLPGEFKRIEQYINDWNRQVGI